MTLEKTPLSARLRQASSIRKHDPILLRAAEEIERLHALTRPDPNDESLITRLRDLLATRNAPAYQALLARSFYRRDITRILEVLDPQPAGADDHLFRDAQGTKLAIDDRVQYTCIEITDNDLWQRIGVIASLGSEKDESVILVRFDGETMARAIHPGRTTKMTTLRFVR